MAAVGSSGNGSQGKGYTHEAAGAEAGHERAQAGLRALTQGTTKGLKAGDLGSAAGGTRQGKLRGGGGGGWLIEVE